MDVSKLKYTLEKPDEVITRDSIIEKRGDTYTFSIGTLISHQNDCKKIVKELSGQRDLDFAKMDNIKRNHDFINDLTDEQLFTVHMYYEAKRQHDMCVPKISEFEEAIRLNKLELDEIAKQIPAYDEIINPPEPIIEQANKVVNNAKTDGTEK